MAKHASYIDILLKITHKDVNIDRNTSHSLERNVKKRKIKFHQQWCLETKQK